MKKTILILLISQLLFCTSLPNQKDTPNLESSLEIKTSLIPKSGNGVFAKNKLEAGIVLGAYKGKFITEAEYDALVKKDLWQYVMWFKDCAKQYSGKYVGVDGREEGSIATRINYAPPKFQNVKFEKLCNPPYVLVRTLRAIDAGEELYIDYGPYYDYEFMKDKEIQKFFKNTK
jgi:SET domain-containing protein